MEVRWNVPDDGDPHIADDLEGGGRAEVLEPVKPRYNPYTIEGQIQQYGDIAMAAKDDRDPVRRRTARVFYLLALLPILGGAAALLISEVATLFKGI